MILGSRRKAQPEAIVRRQAAPQALARIVLLAYAGWPNARIAAELAGAGISASRAGRILADLELRPHKARGWLRRADDGQSWAQAAAVCDAYLRPPPDTVVICIDEKTGIQAKYRKYPGRPPAPGRPARRESEYVRNGTVSAIAALRVATGKATAEPIARNDPVACTDFLDRLARSASPELKIRIVMDNGSSHTSKAAHDRITVTYTPKHPYRLGGRAALRI